MQGFSEWAGRHATAFGMAWDNDLAMLLTWEPVFAAAGYTAAELGAATDWLLVHSGPLRPADHRTAILERVRWARAVAVRHADDDRPDVPRCVLCGGGGLASVPDLAGVRAGQWVGLRLPGGGTHYRTCAVTCSCYRGRQLCPADRQGRRLGADLATYEQANPSWRVQMARQVQEGLAAVAADLARGGGPLDALMRRLLARAAAGQRQPGEDREGEAA